MALVCPWRNPPGTGVVAGGDRRQHHDHWHPVGQSLLRYGQFSFFPFGKEAISRRELQQSDDIGTGALGTIGNIIWNFPK